jgi:hypothetical protein
MRRLAMLLIGSIAVAPLSAQRSAVSSSGLAGHTDFSGTWVLDLSLLEAEEAAHTGKSSMTITQDATTLTSRTTSTQMNREVSASITYRFDSEWKDTVSQPGASVERALSAHWDGPVLVIKTEAEREGRLLAFTHRYSLDSAGAVLTIDTDVAWGDEKNHAVHVYRKSSTRTAAP